VATETTLSHIIQAELEEHDALDGDASIYRRLWSAVLLQAIRDWAACARKEGGDANAKTPFSRHHLYHWFVSTSFAPKSFRWICSVLDLEADEVRKTIFDNPHVLTGSRKS
jgi:hypothetical protein